MSTFHIISREPGQVSSSVQGRACAMAWSCGGRLASGTTEGWVVLADVDSHSNARVKTSFVAHYKDGVEGLSWHPTDLNQLATCSFDKTMKVWDSRSPNRPAQEFKGNTDNYNVNYSPDGHYIAMGSVQKEKNIEMDILGIYDTRTKKRVRSVKLGFGFNDFKFSPNGEFLISGNDEGNIDAFLVGSSVKVSRARSTKAHTAPCKTLDMDPCNRYLASGGSDGLAALWELDDFVCVRTIECEGEVRTVGFSSDGRFLAICVASFLTIVDVETGETVLTIPGETWSLAKFHPTRPILSAIQNTRIRGDFGVQLWSYVD